MSHLGRFSFVPQAVTGGLTGASQVQPTGSCGYLYYQIVDGLTPQVNSLGYSSGQGDGKVIGVIGYDFIQARWSCLFTSNTGLYTHQNTTWEDDINQIKDFMSTLTAPPTVDLAGNDVPYPRSFVGTVG
jgi:hypothetical protein